MTSQEELLTFVKDKIKQLNDIGNEMLAAGNHASKEYRKGAIDTYDIIRIRLEGKVKFAEESPWPDGMDAFKDVYVQEDYPFVME